MRKPTRFLPALALGVAGTISLAKPAIANLITYTETATASVSLGGTSFTNATVTLAMMADTTTVMQTVIGGLTFIFNPGTVTLSILDPVSMTSRSATFTDNTQVSDNPSAIGPNSAGGFGDTTQHLNILFTQNSAFQNYGLTTAIDVLGPASFNSQSPPSFSTSDGNFILTSVNGNVHFTATVSAVPVPTVPPAASLALLVLGFAGLGLIEYRRKSDQR